MPRKQKPPRDDPEESERFIAIAKEIETDPTGEVFERTFPSIARIKPPKAEVKAEAKKRRF
jgi:hypothetical protein